MIVSVLLLLSPAQPLEQHSRKRCYKIKARVYNYSVLTSIRLLPRSQTRHQTLLSKSRDGASERFGRLILRVRHGLFSLTSRVETRPWVSKRKFAKFNLILNVAPVVDISSASPCFITKSGRRPAPTYHHGQESPVSWAAMCRWPERNVYGRGKLSMLMYAAIKRGGAPAKEVCVPAKLQSRCSEQGRRWKDKY